MIDHVLIWLLRVAGSFWDGWNGRNDWVPWLAGHGVIWLKRDVPIIILYWRLYGAFWRSGFKRWLFWTIVHFFAHHLFYQIGESIR